MESAISFYPSWAQLRFGVKGQNCWHAPAAVSPWGLCTDSEIIAETGSGKSLLRVAFHPVMPVDGVSSWIWWYTRAVRWLTVMLHNRGASTTTAAVTHQGHASAHTWAAGCGTLMSNSPDKHLSTHPDAHVCAEAHTHIAECDRTYLWVFLFLPVGWYWCW